MSSETNNSTSYGNIFKTTFVFGFVQVFKAVISIVKNKLVALLIGAEGMGLLGIFNSTLQLIQTGAGLGINQSAVRDVSVANGTGNQDKVSRIINVTNKVVLITGILGCLITLILSHWLSIWTLGGVEYTVSYIILGVAVALNIMNEGRQALLKGMRQLKSLAYASLIGTIVGLVTAVPLYYFFGKDGIVPELLIAAALAFLVSNHFVKKIPYEKLKLSVSTVLTESKPMVKMGTALMFVTFIQMIMTVVINAYIRREGGLEVVGFYSAGATILTGYFGLIVTALSTDYYPRIAAVNEDNIRLQDELNKQSKVSLVICCPMFIVVMVFLPLFIQLLYSSEFLPATEYVKYAIYWSLITICSNQVDMILLAKFKAKIFMTISVIFRIVQLGLCIGLYSGYGLAGLGFSYALLGVLHMTIMCTVVYKLYHISFDKEFVVLGGSVLILALAASFISSVDNLTVRYVSGGLLTVFSLVFSYVVSKRRLGLDWISIVKTKMNK